MKRLFLFLVCVLMLVSLAACGRESNKNVVPVCRTNENVSKVANKAVEILDDYLNLATNLDDTNTLLFDLHERMQTMDGTDYTEYEYSDPNYIVLSRIDFCIPIREGDLDSEIEEARDIIAFNAGIAPLKQSHGPILFQPDSSVETSEKEIMDKLGVIGLPATSCFIIVDDNNYISIFITFDTMYGVSISDFCDYAYDIYEKAYALYGSDFNLFIELSEYKYDILHAIFHGIDDDLSGNVYVRNSEGNGTEVHGKGEFKQSVQTIWDNR